MGQKKTHYKNICRIECIHFAKIWDDDKIWVVVMEILSFDFGKKKNLKRVFSFVEKKTKILFFSAYSDLVAQRMQE